jgi:hypothetical protein
MERVDIRRLIWWGHRTYLRHGAVMVVALIGGVLLLVLLAAMAWSHMHLARVERELHRGVEILRARPIPQGRREKVQALPLPAITQRFAITRRIISVLKDTGLQPERMRFKFETIQDAGLTRQVAVFTLKARWDEIAAALARLQATERSLYISRLRLSRENLDDEQVSAEVQLAVALVDRAVVAEAKR